MRRQKLTKRLRQRLRLKKRMKVLESLLFLVKYVFYYIVIIIYLFSYYFFVIYLQIIQVGDPNFNSDDESEDDVDRPKGSLLAKPGILPQLKKWFIFKLISKIRRKWFEWTIWWLRWRGIIRGLWWYQVRVLHGLRFPR